MKPLIIAIGASAGGVEALKIVLQGLKKPSQSSVLIVLHFPPEGPNLLPEIYRDICDFEIKEAESGERMLPETVYIAPPNYHLSAESDWTLSLSTEEPVNFSRPSIDILMDSVAVSMGELGVGILLTGSNHDGAAGMHRISESKGLTVIQDPEEADFPEMPRSCLKFFRPDHVLPLEEIQKLISNLTGV